MCTKTKEEREKHYMTHFINNPLFASTLLNLKQAEEAKTADTAIPFHYADDPPWPTFDSLLSQDMEGYMPAQADVIEQFDNYVKWDLRYWFCRRWLGHFTRSEDGCSSYLSCQVKGETKIKKKLWDHGLINLGKFQLMERRYPRKSKTIMKKMRQFARIVGPVGPEKFIESQALEFELWREIKRLQEYRTAGITNFCSPRIYNHLKKRNLSNAECTLRSSSISRTAAPACSGSAGRLTLIPAWVLLPEWLRIQVDEVYCPWNSVASLAQRSGVKKKKKKKKKKGALSDSEVGPRSLFRIQICSTEQMQQARGLETGTGKSTHQVRCEQNPENLWFPHLRRIHRQSLWGSPGVLRAKGPQGILEPHFWTDFSLRKEEKQKGNLQLY